MQLENYRQLPDQETAFYFTGNKNMAKETTIETVAMTDGTVREFTGKRKLVKESFQHADGSLELRLYFRNGEVRNIFLNPALTPKYALHGAEQKFGDEIAGIEEIEDAVAAVDALIDRHTAGEWSIVRESGQSFAGASIIIRALMEHSRKTKEQVNAFIESKLLATEQSGQKLTRQALYASFKRIAAIAEIVARLEAERAAKRGPGVIENADDLLGELEA